MCMHTGEPRDDAVVSAIDTAWDAVYVCADRLQYIPSLFQVLFECCRQHVVEFLERHRAVLACRSGLVARHPLVAPNFLAW